MQIVIDISKDRYDEIMSMDWKNCRLLFDEELRAIHDGKALEQEPCGDYISREAVIKTITEWLFSKEFHYTNATEYLRKRLDELPSVTPQPKMAERWIPCSERLPEQDRKDEAGNDIAFLVQTEWGVFFTATYDGKNWCHVDSSVLVESDVIAWMPLPKLYQSEIQTVAEGSEK